MENVDPAQLVFAVGRIGPGGLQLLGTCFSVEQHLLATAAHVTAGDDRQLCVIPAKTKSLNDYQDNRSNQFQFLRASIHSINPTTDVALLKVETKLPAKLRLSSSDAADVGQTVKMWGYPHADLNRAVLTQFSAQVGAKVIVGTAATGVKHLVINSQARTGQSGGPVFLDSAVIGLVVGAFSPVPAGKGIMLGNIDPYTLHQTTHVVSAEYVGELLADG